MDQFVNFVINNWLLWLALVVILVLLFSESLGQGRKHWLLPQEVVKLMNRDNALLLDTRDAQVYRQGHIIGAQNNTVKTIEANIKKYQKYKDKPVIVYCATGQQAMGQLRQLSKLGFTQLHAIKGGVQAWQQANLPLERG